MISRLAIASLVAAALVPAAVASAARTAPAGPASAAAGCRSGSTSLNWRAVFAHESTLIAAKARLSKLQAAGYKTAKIENRGCNDFAIVLESPRFSSYSVRTDFEQEAAAAKLLVTYSLPGNAKAKPGDVNVVFGHSRTLAGAAKLLAKVAGAGWRETDIVYGGPNDWKVVWPLVPGSGAESTVQAAVKAGLMVELELVGQ